MISERERKREIGIDGSSWVGESGKANALKVMVRSQLHKRSLISEEL